jgi:CRISPR-associated protein Csc1
MQAYRCDLVLHDYLFFATTERGKVAETGPFIHNYALTYALGWAVAPWCNEIQRPRYREQLARAGNRYVTPAALVRGSYLTTQYNTMSERYRLRKIQSAGYPDWGFLKCFRPGSLFRCYVLSAGAVQFPRYIRLGKFMTKTAVFATPASSLQIRLVSFNEREARQQDILHPLLTWNDLPLSARPVVYDIIANALPSRLIEHAVFTGIEGPYLAASFDGDPAIVQLPARMGYYGEHLCSSW